ncbi:polysaccharide biosynthesis/export family protein [Oceanisphaera psychrotolerans]|uniref:Capsular biosynthesis protein n=1 Tax=Oceanisphaera psychrotolerans TaxID=1414654 RepID=A0A1J4QEB5_9GAMM|nr:polysaccharide biosynthesis/export family protein [Oceanisphaera psychrotolerans]OIN07246.1 capsular biosynthesis protein [Oceanisphaera psychrotolerans]
MKVIHTLCILLVWALGAGAVQAQDSGSQYALGSGDLIRVSVFGEQDLSFEQIRLNDAGTFSYPFLGSVNAKGKTAKQVENLIINGLRGDYLIDPKVSVSILEYREFYINGEVGDPGGYPFQPGMTLRKAVALAGGFSERASRSAYYIIRDADQSRTPQKASLDTPVMPGDIITIEQSFF